MVLWERIGSSLVFYFRDAKPYVSSLVFSQNWDYLTLTSLRFGPRVFVNFRHTILFTPTRAGKFEACTHQEMLHTVGALRKALDAPPALTLPDSVKFMSELMGLPTAGVNLPCQVEALVEATGLGAEEGWLAQRALNQTCPLRRGHLQTTSRSRVSIGPSSCCSVCMILMTHAYTVSVALCIFRNCWLILWARGEELLRQWRSR